MQVTNIVNGVDIDRLFGTIDAVNASIARRATSAWSPWTFLYRGCSGSGMLSARGECCSSTLRQ